MYPRTRTCAITAAITPSEHDHDGDHDFAQLRRVWDDSRGMEQPRLDYQKLDVYKRSIDFLGLALRISKALPRGERELRDQLKRAAMSIPLNIAEGYGKPSSNDRARFHAIARGSAMECSAVLDVCRTAGHLSIEDAATGHDLLFRLVSMLTKMCR